MSLNSHDLKMVKLIWDWRDKLNSLESQCAHVSCCSRVTIDHVSFIFRETATRTGNTYRLPRDTLAAFASYEEFLEFMETEAAIRSVIDAAS